jgi:probable rRNA maturation factor
MKSRFPAPLPVVDIVVPAAAWKRTLPQAAAICRRAAIAAWTEGAPRNLKRNPQPAEIAVILSSDRAIRRLNAAYRGKDKPTNVLSFPTYQSLGDVPPSVPAVLGDVVVAFETTAREAKAAAKPLRNHVSHMVVHGVLHLLGYDHESDTDAKTMERLEIRILSQLGIADPYIADDGARKVRATVRTRKRSSTKP